MAILGSNKINTGNNYDLMQRALFIAGLLLGCVAFTWFFPLFHIVPLNQAAATRSHGDFDATKFTREFWDSQLVPAFDQAHDAAEVMTAIKEDADAARGAYGKSVGIGRVHYYFVRGEGTVLSIEKTGVTVSCIAPDGKPDLILKSGLLFGNTVRDATGQLRASNFSNSQDFNAISQELNRIVEREVLPTLEQDTEVGAKVRFVGCAEVRASNKSALPLTVIPLKVEFPR